MPLFPSFVSRRLFVGGWLLLGLLLGACQPTAGPGPGIRWLPPLPLLPAPPEPASPYAYQPEPDSPSDTLVRQQAGFYFCLEPSSDTTDFFRQLPPPPRLPTAYADYQLYYARRPVGQYYDENVYRPLPRQFRLPGGVQVQMYHHEHWELATSNEETSPGYREPELGCDQHRYMLNAWHYNRQFLEFPQLRTAAGPLLALNRALQVRYEVVAYNPDYSAWGNRDVGKAVLPFALTPAQLARRPYYLEIDSSWAADTDLQAEWRARYRLLDTVDTYQHFPSGACLVRLGPRHQLLGLTDYFDQYSRMPERTTWDEDLDAGAPAYYSLRLGRRVAFADLFGPALSRELLQTIGPWLHRERRRRPYLPSLDTTAARELRERLRTPLYWEFTRRGLYAVYAGRPEYETNGHRIYHAGFSVLIPFYRLRDFLRP